MLRKFIKGVQQIGLENTKDRLEYQRALMVNTLTLSIQVFIVALMMVVFGYQLWIHLTIGIASFLALKPTYYLNKIGKFNWAALYLINLCVLGILTASYFAFYDSRFSETENWLCAFIAVSVFLFDGARMRFHFWAITILLLGAKVLKFYILEIPMGQDFVLLLVNTIILCLGLFVFLLIFKYGLRRSLDKLEEADRTKNKLFSIVAHDLRSPFALFETMLEAGKKELITQDQFLELQKNLQQKFEPIKDTVTTLLDWSQVQLNNIEPELVVFQVRSEIERVLSSLEMATSEKKQTVSWKGDFGSIETDVNHFRITIRNIIHNAVKFSPNGSDIEIGCSEDSTHVTLSIKDQGDGMETEKINQILNNKPLMSSRGTSGEKGTGIGLHLAKELLDKNDIKLSIDSKVGVGSVFTLKIPKRIGGGNK